MSAYAKQKRREHSCFSPKTGQAAASHEKPGYGQQHDDTTGHHPKAHQVRLGIHFNLGFGRHLIFFFPKRFSVFAALPQGKVKDTFGYKKNRFGHFQNDILMELISRELSIERRGPFLSGFEDAHEFQVLVVCSSGADCVSVRCCCG
ncbi:hypothetical protein [Oricola indica]|uniref:hypothetical protein n=1 Tax=Oricola indica TaxID=2872591 RepID=UPI003CCC2BA2